MYKCVALAHVLNIVFHAMAGIVLIKKVHYKSFICPDTKLNAILPFHQLVFLLYITVCKPFSCRVGKTSVTEMCDSS